MLRCPAYNSDMGEQFGSRIVARNQHHAGFEATEFASYDQVPWYRKRWFFVLMVLLLTPVGIIMAFTGEIYLLRSGQVLKFSKSNRIMLAVAWSVLLALNLARA